MAELTAAIVLAVEGISAATWVTIALTVASPAVGEGRPIAKPINPEVNNEPD
jgi:hypothetical protein